jgi:hypothetical protein
MARLTAERREMHEVVVRHSLDRLASFAPGRQAADDDEGVESVLAKDMRHTGAGGFALSSTVQVDVLILRERRDFLRQIIRLNADGAENACGAPIVVAVAAHIHHQNLVGAS